MQEEDFANRRMIQPTLLAFRKTFQIQIRSAGNNVAILNPEAVNTDIEVVAGYKMCDYVFSVFILSLQFKKRLASFYNKIELIQELSLK